jgi:hypothetical protein
MPYGKRPQSSQSFSGLIKIRNGTSVPDALPLLGRNACRSVDPQVLLLWSSNRNPLSQTQLPWRVCATTALSWAATVRVSATSSFHLRYYQLF